MLRQRTRSGASAPESGTTLLELIMTVAIMGVAFASLLGGMFTFSYGASAHQHQASGAQYIREYAEAVAGTTYQACATPASYVPTTFAVPATWVAAPIVVTYWNGAAFVAACAPDSGLQRVHLSLSDVRDAETIDVVKRAP
jgi:type II secretory pathway pseudopilin PulG